MIADNQRPLHTIGYHVSRIFHPRKSLCENIEEYVKNIGSTSSIQVFVAGPRECKLRLTDDDAIKLKQCLSYLNLYAVAHGTYLDHPWNTGNIWFINKEIEICAKAGIKGFLIHMSNNPISQMIPVIEKINNPDVTLYLETPAMKPTNSVYADPNNLIKLYEAIRQYNTAICIDTAHVYSCGIGLSSYNEMKTYMDIILSVIPPDRLLIHLNDNHNPCGGGKDKHAMLLKGVMWGDYANNIKASGLWYLFELIETHKIRAILELDTKEDLQYDFSIIHGYENSSRDLSNKH